MKAIVWHGRRDVRYEEVPDPGRPGPGEVSVRVAFAGICGTDLEEYTDGPLFVPVVAPHPLTGRKAPLILGHEFSGVIEALGDGVERFRVGDHVAADTLMYCGECEECRHGRFNLCPNLAALGQMADGGLAERVVAPAYAFVKLPSGVPLDHAALAEPLAVAVRGVRRAQLSPGDRVLIMGAGTIGLMALAVARDAGVGTVTVVEPRASRAALARALRADDVRESWAGLPGGVRFDRALECTGKPQAQVAALRLLRPQGRLVLIGIPTAATMFDTMDIVNTEREVVGSLSHLAEEDFRQAVDMLSAKRVDVAPFISRRYPLSQGVDAFKLLERGEDDILKILMSPHMDT